MIADLSMRSRRAEARAAVEAATVGAAGPDLLVRQEQPWGGEVILRWDVARVLDQIEHADALSWEVENVLVVRRRGDYLRRFVLTQTGQQTDRQTDGQTDRQTDRQSGQRAFDGQLLEPAAEAAVQCRPCGLPGERPVQAHAVPAAEDLARVHDRWHHGGHPTAQAVPVERAVAWEVDAADGAAVYRGTDLELAHELMRLEPKGACLVPLAGPVGPMPPLAPSASGVEEVPR